MKHYHAIAGLHGCLPNYNEVCESIGDACDCLSSLHELSKKRDSKLRMDLYLELNLRKDGNEYCEVTECDEPLCLNEKYL